MRDIEVFVVIGSRVDVESGVISLLSRYNIPLAIVSRIGVSILSSPVVTFFNETRRKQYLLPEDDKRDIVTRILEAKFSGFVNILKYHGVEPPEITWYSDIGGDFSSMLQWEALTSRIIWRSIIELIPLEVMDELKSRYGFEGRKPRARDPFNKSISLLYALLYGISTRALLATGLDPTCGLHHKTRFSTPLVYDYVEMYKPIAVHAVIRVLRKTRKLPGIDREGDLKRESIKTIAEEFFNILKSKTQRSRYTIHRLIYINAHRLAERIRGNKESKYTYIYQPRKLQQITKT